MKLQLNRRQFAGTLASTILAPLPSFGAEETQSGQASLRDIAAARGLTYGAAVTAQALQTEPDFRDVVIRECATIVSEGGMKWAAIEPQAGIRRYGEGDSLAAFAAANKMSLHGHCLVWHEAMPQWLREALSNSGADKLLETHIADMVGRYRGRVSSWDVVNEALDHTVENGGLRRSLWYRSLGADYIALAFASAHATAPGCDLAYNDFGFEHEVDWQLRKRRFCLELLADMRKRGVPCRTFGVQAHLIAHAPFREESFAAFLNEIAAMGFRIVISELDVDDAGLPDDVAVRDKMSAQVVRRFLDCALACKAVDKVVTWGLSDRHTWLNAPQYSRRGQRPPARPLPLDANGLRKPIWHAMAAAFAAAPRRG
jgi:endo-1,4-beta-xylanase